MKLRRLSLFVAAPLFLSAASLIPGSCFAQSVTTAALAEPQQAAPAPQQPAPQQAAPAPQRPAPVPKKPAPAPRKIKLDKPFRSYGIGVKLSTLGAGVEVATPVTW